MSDLADIYAVFGGTGFLGRRVVKSLLRAGHRVRIVARNPHSRSEAGVESVAANMLRPESLGPALHGAAAVLNATSLYRETGDVSFEAFHVEAASGLAAAARAAGVGRFLQISGIGSDPVASDPYIRARGRGKRAVRQAFPGAVVIRPSAMFGEGEALVSMILETARRLPVFPLFGRGETRLQPVHVGDVASACGRLLAYEQVQELYEFGGPRVLSYRQMVCELGEAAGLTVRPLPVSFAVWRLMALASKFSPHAPLTLAQVALMERDNIVSGDSPGLLALGITPRDITETAARHSPAT